MSASLAPSPQHIGSRFNLVSAIPTTTLVVLVGALLVAGAPSQPPDLTRLRERLADLNAADVALLIVVSVTLALLLNPFQVSFVKALEGYWPASRITAPVERLFRARHTARWDRLNALRITKEGIDAKLVMLPSRDRLMPTRLGNALRHAEDLAGKRYGLGAVQVIPRMWPVMSERMVAVIDDARNELDVMASFVFVWLVATGATFGLLYQYGPWLMVPVVTFGLAWLSYAGCVTSARSYGQTLIWAVDLYRFELYAQLHIELPDTHEAERERNEKLTSFLAGRWLAYREPKPKWAPRYVHSEQRTPEIARDEPQTEPESPGSEPESPGSGS
ncbi:MAG: hypothetical protein V7607_1698 [Solirubrobacteraceae bacterium]